MMESNVRLYLEDLESELMFGKCAGKNAHLMKLHQNKVQDKNQRVLNFERLRRCLIYHPLGPDPRGYKKQMIDVEEEFIPQLPASIVDYNMDIGDTFDDWNYVRDPLTYSWINIEPYFEDLSKDKEYIEKILAIYDKFEFESRWIAAASNQLIFENIDLQFKEQTIEWSELVEACDSIFIELNKIDEIWPFIKSKSANVHSQNSDRIKSNFTKEHLELGIVDRISSTTNSQKTYIFGGPGYGKTIFTQQIASELTNRELYKDRNDCFIPIFVKAKYVSEGITKFCNLPWAIQHDGEYVGEPDENSTDITNENYIHYGLSLNPLESGLEEAAQILRYAMIKTLPGLNENA